MSPIGWVAVALLGGAAAAARHFLDGAVSRVAPGRFPLGILAVNVGGALVLGVVVGSALDGEGGTIVAGGILGSFTTFSTLILDTELLGRDERRLAVANVAVSLAAGFAAFCLGHWLAAI